jgi:hypothetical protein
VVDPIYFEVMALANNMCSFLAEGIHVTCKCHNKCFRTSTLYPEVEYDQSEPCTTSFAKFEDFSQEKKEILQLRSGCSHKTFI